MLGDSYQLPLVRPWEPMGFDIGKLSDEECLVYLELLRGAVGLESAIGQRELARRCWRGDRGQRVRQLRLILKRLTEHHGIGVATSCRAPHLGVYLVQCEGDLIAYTDNLFARAMSVLRRCAKLKRTHAAELAGQVRLALEEAG